MIQPDLLWRHGDGSWGADADSPGVARATAIDSTLVEGDSLLLQYNPFLYGRWGFAPWLPLMLLKLRSSSKHPLIALMVHEPFVPMNSWRWALMGIWQRLQLTALRFCADLVFASTEAWTKRLAGEWPRRPTYHLPVASNVPDERQFRQQQREMIGASDDTIVLATFGQNHPGRLLPCIVDASNSLVEAGTRVVLLNLGAEAPPMAGLSPDIVVHSPGSLSAECLSRWLSAADIYLGPFVDGVSTRRTTLMAAMQHGLPVVTTDGPLTDSVLRCSDGLHLVPVSRPDQFAQTVRRLAESPRERRASGARARDQYTSRFDWPVLASRLSSLLREHESHSRIVRGVSGASH